MHSLAHVFPRKLAILIEVFVFLFFRPLLVFNSANLP
jgi:hypothetical protein